MVSLGLLCGNILVAQTVVTGSITDGAGNVNIVIKEDIDGYFRNLVCNTFYKIIFLKRVPDETSITLNLIKPSGQTSYGLAIPTNVNQTVLDNIDTITKYMKQQLIDAIN
jgi:hypothetical protein